MARCPIAPIGLAATAGLNRVDLVWQAGSVPSLAGDGPNPWGPAHHYLVQVTGDGSARLVETQALALAVPGLRNGVEYTFEVFGVTDAGRSSGSGPVKATPTSGAEGVVAGLIVEFAPGTSVREGQASVPGEAGVDAVDLTVGEQVSQDAILVELSEPVSLDEAKTIAADLQADPAVEWAEPDQFLFTASDNAAPAAWNLSGAFGVDATSDPSAGLGATVAVIDTGIASHPALQGKTVSGYDFVSSPEQLMASRQPNAPPVAFDGDYANTGTFGVVGRDANPADPGDWRDVAPTRASSWHGTQMAGVISSIVPGAKIQPVRALSWRGGLLSDIAASITWASGGEVENAPVNENPSKVINMSFAVEAMCPTALQAAIDDARSRGSILIAAAGNANDDAAKYAPGNCNGVLTVGATNSAGLRADYSNHGRVIDLSAPGGDATQPVTSVSNTGTTIPAEPGAGSDFGTSIAAAHVSAGAAMLAGATPTITPDDAYRTLTGRDYTKEFANPTCDANPDYSCGAGILSLAQIASISSGDQDFAMTLNGTTQGAIAGSTSAFTSSLTSAVSVAAWVRPEACTSFSMVLDQWSTVSLTCYNNTWQAALGSNWAWTDSGITARLNEWQHVAFTRAAGSDTINFYFNGQLAATKTGVGTGTLGTALVPLSVGYRSYLSNQYFFKGRIDEVRLFNTAITSTQVLASMSTYGPVNESGLIAYYDFNEGPAGTTGSGTVYNRVSGATTPSNLRTLNGPTYIDIKQTTSNGSNTVVTFPRSYLTAAGGWRVPQGVSTARTLVVGGGGGGGAHVGGGGGGGQVTATAATSVTPGSVVTVNVGVGGRGASLVNPTFSSGANGGTSYFGAVTATGGGVGTSWGSQEPGGTGVANGGGGAYYAGGVGSAYTGGSGYASPPYAGGGGAGAGANGGAASSNGVQAGNGGAGASNDITGASVVYGGGGGGGVHGTFSSSTWGTSGSGGSGGGATGASATSLAGVVRASSGVSGLGGGGGGAGQDASTASYGGSGGSGVVIVSYTNAASGACAPTPSTNRRQARSTRSHRWSRSSA